MKEAILLNGRGYGICFQNGNATSHQRKMIPTIMMQKQCLLVIQKSLPLREIPCSLYKYFNVLHNDDTNNFNFVKVLIDLDEYINAITSFDWFH